MNIICKTADIVTLVKQFNVGDERGWMSIVNMEYGEKLIKRSLRFQTEPVKIFCYQ